MSDNTPLYLWLPGLCGTGAACPASFCQVHRLDIGVPRHLWEDEAAPVWTPADLPLTGRDMAALVDSIGAMVRSGAKDGAGASLTLAVRARQEEEARERLRQETAAVARLAQSGPDGEDGEKRRREARLQAQQLLAWVWVQQHLVAEVSALLADIDAGLGDLAGTLAAGEQDAGQDGENGRLPQDLVQSFLDARAEAAALLDKWPLVLEKALAFAPQDTVFVFEQVPAAAEHLWEEASDLPFATALDPNARGLCCATRAVLPRAAGELPDEVRLVFLPGLEQA